MTGSIGIIRLVMATLGQTLRDGAIDVLLGRFASEPPGDLVQGPVMSRENWVLGVARGHPLASRDVVSVEELTDHGIFGVPHSVTGELHNPLYPAQTPKGRPIPRRGIARTFAEVLALVARGENVFPAGESFPAHYGHPDVVFVPLHGWPLATRTLIWRARQLRAGGRLHRHGNGGPRGTGSATARHARLRRLARPPRPRHPPVTTAQLSGPAPRRGGRCSSPPRPSGRHR